MPIRVESRLYQSVAGLDEANLDYVIPNGNILYLIEMGGDAGGMNENTVSSRIIWDPTGGGVNEIIFNTYGNTSQTTVKTFTGNGTKVLRILLTNNAVSPRVMGAYFIGDLGT